MHQKSTPLIRLLLFVVLFLASMTNSQTNTWTQVAGSTLGEWFNPGLVYSTQTHEYVLTMGAQKSSVYCVQDFISAQGRWINALPHDSLYGSSANANSVDSAAGKWADSTGSAYSVGSNAGAGFGWRPRFVSIRGYLRPNLACDDIGSVIAYSQFCYNSDDGKIYFYLNNQTVTYNTVTRRFDTLSAATHPNDGALPNVGMGFDKNNNGTYVLRWGALCYDAYNQEVVAVGGGAIDKQQGCIGGTWTFKPSTGVWTKLTQLVQPGPRANSPMAYDAVNRCIVLFGGDHLDGLMNDTWVYDCVTKTWSKKNPAIRPKPRAGHALLYLPSSHKVVLMGGYRFEADQQTEFEMWTYDVVGNDWALIKRFNAETWPRLYAMKPAFSGMVAVSGGDTVIALGDSTLNSYHFYPYTYRMAVNTGVIDLAGTTTYGLTHDTLAIAGSTYDPAYWKNLAASDTATNEAFLRNIPLGTWTKLTPPATPAGDRTWGTTNYDPDHDRLIKWGGGHAAYCGTDLPNYFISKNRWEIGYRPEFPMEINAFNEPSPGPFTFNNRPFMPTHPVKSSVYDIYSRRLLLVDLLYTYIYDPDSLDFEGSLRIPATVPSYGGMATYRQGTCSTPHGAFNLSTDQCYLFSADSMRWRKLPQSGVALPAYYADATGLTYDSKRDRIVYAAQTYGDMTRPVRLYEYSFTTGVATQIFPQDSALTTGTNMWRECVYLPGLDIILYTVQSGSAHVAYDCANNRWITIPVTGLAAGMNDIGTGMSYDAKRNLIWLATNNSTIYALRVDSNGLKTELGRMTPNAFLLSASPNPFGISSTINISLPAQSEKAMLQVYGIDGRLVRTLGMNNRAGAQRIIWDGRDNAGKRISAGLYLYKLTAGSKVLKCRAVMAK